MRFLRSLALPLVLALSVGALPAPAAAQVEVDVLVYGGTSAGVIAAYTAKQYGRSVLLVEPGRHLGGMSSGGLGHTDIGNKYAITGLGLDFYRRLGRYYGQFEAWQFEPKAAEQVFEAYLDEAGVEVLFSRRLKGLEKDGTRIGRVTLEYAGSGRGAGDLVVTAKQFIDATYEGDLMAKAGASYTVGREANSVYGERYNGVQLRETHQFPEGVDPYVVPGDPRSGLVPEISGVGLAAIGSGDRKVQTYNFRMALCQGENRIPITAPEGYDTTRYELLARVLAKRVPERLTGTTGKPVTWAVMKIDRMPNGKTDVNNRGAFSTDYIGKSWEYPEAGYAQRAEIWEDHERYQKGLLHFIATDARVPRHLRDEMRSWGYCPDEFLDTNGWPHALYVREARRMVGEYVMTEHDVTGREIRDGVGMAAYTMDSHNVQRVVLDGMVKNEGDVQVGGFPPYPISYRALTPKRAEVTNLLVPVALSASHIAYGSIRMEPVFLVLGQAVALAASMAIEAGVSVQTIDVAALQKELRENPLAHGGTPDVLVDDGSDAVRVTGEWSPVDSGVRYGPTALRSEGRDGGSVRFLPRFRAAGAYRVYLQWPRTEGAASNVPVEIRHADGTVRRVVDLRGTDRPGERADAWYPLGEYRFDGPGDAWVEIGTRGADGPVFADAVLFVPVDRR